MTKSEVAFRMSAARLFEENRKVYFWTFTFTEIWEDWVYSRQWARFWRAFCDSTNFFIGGLKVVELHPGGHGIHYHCLLNKRLPVSEIRRIGKRFGVGRVHVVAANKGAGEYLAKYLSKRETGLSKHIRKWSTVGGFEGVKVANIEVDTDFVRKLRDVKGGRHITFAGYQIARREYVKDGRISLQTICNNLRRPNLPQYERMLMEAIDMRRRQDEQDQGLEYDSDYPVVVRYIWRGVWGQKRAAIYSILSRYGVEEQGPIQGYAATRSQASLICQFLNDRLKEKSYAV